VPLPDKTLTCADCGQEFLFSGDDQEFYQSRGFSEPKRCRSCRAQRRSEREGSEGGGGGGGGGGGFNRGPRVEREMFEVTCSSCGNLARVPFQPRGDRPVYCRDCFDRVGGGGGGRSSYSR
jgi:CxxC-x17-CxxC domain-containing protein